MVVWPKSEKMGTTFCFPPTTRAEMSNHATLSVHHSLKIASVVFGSAGNSRQLAVDRVNTAQGEPSFTFNYSNNDPIEFIQYHADQEPLVKVDGDDGLRLDFQLEASTEDDTDLLTSLTYVCAGSPQDLNRLITREFSTDPNFQNHEQVSLIGNVPLEKASGSKVIDWSWNYIPIGPLDFRYNGRPIYVCFAEYDKHSNCLVPLDYFQFWVKELFTDSSQSPLDEQAFRQLQRPVDAMPYEQTQTDTSAVPSDAILSPIHYPSVREMDQAEPQDGPLFRATMLNFERTANETRSALKKVIKRSEDYAQTSGLMYVSNNEFSQVLSKAANVNPPAFGPFVDHYHRESSRLLSSFYLDRAQLVRSKLVEPLRKIYENDIKTTDSKKKDFEERSRDFYASLSRYLSKNKEADKVKDSKFSAKKREFELTRFDYYSYMQDINGGRKGQEILSVLTNFATQDYALINQLLSDIKNLRPNLDVLRETVTEADKEFQLIRAGREERRRTLETSTLESEDLDAELAAQAYSVQLEKSSAAKQGLLLALSKTSSDIQVVPKTNWHKYWVVLDHGRICEYSNWKQSLELHTEPINLLMASVREAKNVGRRFCFEVITPQLRRVYQATSQTELVSWLEAIQAAIAESIALKGKKQHGDSSIISNTNHRNLSSASSNGGNALHRRASSLSPGQRHTRSESVEVKVSKPSLVSVLKTLHPSDEYCADCGSRTKVEWCSINFPVVLCIDCSGIHRSLGTHISKVRSLTLDKLSHETVELLRNTGNALVNDIYEANLPSSAQKQAMLDSPLSRASFIKDKYTKRAYVQSVPGDALETLLEAIKANNIRDIIWCLASIEGVIPTIAMETALKQDALMIAELLGHNGVALPTDEAFLASCSVKARQYIAYRTGKQVVIPASTTTAPKVTRHSTSTSHSELPTGGRATD